MSEPFLAEIRIVGFNFAPRGWAFCDGQILPISQNQSLYTILGITYGGDGRTSFALPDLRGRAPIHRDAANTLGTKSGAETHTLTVQELPSHTHEIKARTANAQASSPAAQFLAYTEEETYAAPTDLVAMDGDSVSNTGAGQEHSNMQPYLAVNFCIALQGLFPSRS